MAIGTEDFWDYERLTSKNALEPKQETGLMREHFRITGIEPIDELEFSVIFEQEGEEKKTSASIPVEQYKNKNKYIFPLKGTWFVFGNWDDPHNHRVMHSQEFAMDIIQLNDDLSFPQEKKVPNESFACYGKDILAIAGGVVVDCFNQTPENPNTPDILPKEQLAALIQEHGYVPMVSGNYVTIKHSEEEYSFYAHILEGSVKVKKGEKVKQGQIIGRLGNSGHSTGPHLHFQLMDGPSILTA